MADNGMIVPGANKAALASVLVGICLGMWMLQNYITTRKSYRLLWYMEATVSLSQRTAIILPPECKMGKAAFVKYRSNAAASPAGQQLGR